MKYTRQIVSIYNLLTVGMLLIFLSGAALVSAQPITDCSGICDLAWSPVEETLLVAVDLSGLWLVDTKDNRSDPQFFPHKNATSLSFDPTGQFIAVTSCPALTAPTNPCNGSISLFDIKEQSWIELGTYDYSIGNVKFSPNGRYVAFQKDETRAWGIQLIDLTTNDTFSIVERNFTNLVINYAFNSQSNYIAISNGSIGGDVFFMGLSVWRLSDQTLQASTKGSIFAADLTFTEIEHNIMFVEYDTKVSLWDYHADTISSLNKLNETVGDNLHRLSFSYPPTYLLAALLDDWHPGDRMLFVWDIQSGEQVFFQDMPEGSFVNLIVMNSTGEYIAFSSTVDQQKIVRIWERSTDTNKQIALTD